MRLKKPNRIFLIILIAYFFIIPFVLYYIKKNENNSVYYLLLNDLIIASIILCLALFLINIVSYLREYFKLKEKNNHPIRDIVISLTLRWLRIIIPIFAADLIIETLDRANKISFYMSHIKEVLVIASIGWFFCVLVYALETYILSKFNISTKNNLKNRGIVTQVQILKKILLSIIAIITIALILLLFDSFQRYGASLLASAGVVGIAISFAAQKTLSNLLMGFQMAFTQPIRIDDAILIEGEWGRVEEITLTYITVCIWDQRRLIVPISYFLEKPIQNWTKKSAEIIGTIFLYLDFSAPVNKIEEEVMRLCKSTPLWDERVVCTQVTNTTASYIEVRILASAQDSPTSFDLRCYIRKNIIEYLQINYPNCFAYQRTFLTMEKSLIPNSTQ